MSKDTKDLLKLMKEHSSRNIERHEAHVYMHKAYDWDKYIAIIPSISFPSEWKIQIIPPYAGAVIRFRAFYKNKEISVYLDCFNMLSIMYHDKDMSQPKPHWEAYQIDGDTFRCDMNNVDELITAMKDEFAREDEK